jgi:membrane fusion protein (multidrug efflux system)
MDPTGMKIFERISAWRPHLPGLVWRLATFLVAIIIVIVITTQWTRWEGRAGAQETDDAYLQADLTPISAKVPGYVRAIPVQDFERVKAGQVLAEIEDDDYRATVAQVEANVAAAKAQIETLDAQRALQEANIRAARAVVAAATATFEQTGRDVRRQKTLVATGSASVESNEHVDTTRAQLAAQLDQNTAQAVAAERQLDVLTAQLAQAQAALAAQVANLNLARINLGYTRIVAPQDGVIGQRQVKPGQYLGVGGQVATLTPLPNVWVIANYRETQLTHVAVGQHATVTVDTYPGHVLRGHVIALSPASGSQFALLPPDNATGNFTKVVQRIAVKIVIDDADGLADRLLPGMSVVPTIEATDERAAADGTRK